jgi:hypothetical protein
LYYYRARYYDPTTGRFLSEYSSTSYKPQELIRSDPISPDVNRKPLQFYHSLEIPKLAEIFTSILQATAVLS